MKRIAIIGAGLVGSLQAVLLAKRGYKVDLYEGRSDMRAKGMLGGKSINLALSERGWTALRLAGVDKRVAEMAIPMKSRCIHMPDGEIMYQPYGKEGQAIYSVSRGGLNKLLLTAAEEMPEVSIHFSHKCTDIDLASNSIAFEVDGKAVNSPVYNHIFGTDGAFSAVRTRLQKTERFNYSQYYLEHGYKELVIPAKEGTHQIDANSLHIWPRGEFMLIALPNLDGSFTCTLFFPYEGKHSFASLTTPEKVVSFFEDTFSDAVALMPTLTQDFFENPTGSLVTIKCAPWNYQDKIGLIGDASHAIVPFYGQGMNAGFEDCTLFDNALENGEDIGDVISRFGKTRAVDADAIAELAVKNFIEMRDKTGDTSFLLRKKIEKRLSERFPDKWMPLYSQVTFSNIPYSDALKAGKRQELIMDQIMDITDIETRWDSDEIENEILRLLV